MKGIFKVLCVESWSWWHTIGSLRQKDGDASLGKHSETLPSKMYVFSSLKSKYGCSSISLTSERQMCKKMCMVSRAKEVQRGLEIKENGYCHEGQKKMRGGMGGQGWAGEGKDDTSQSVSLIGLDPG